MNLHVTHIVAWGRAVQCCLALSSDCSEVRTCNKVRNTPCMVERSPLYDSLYLKWPFQSSPKNSPYYQCLKLNRYLKTLNRYTTAIQQVYRRYTRGIQEVYNSYVCTLTLKLQCLFGMIQGGVARPPQCIPHT